MPMSRTSGREERSAVFLHRSSDAKTGCCRRRPLLLLGSIIALLLAATIVLRRRGYGIGGDTVVRCQQGHLFTTIWIPGASLKAVRLGWWRFQWCPVGRHWSLVTPVREADLSEDEKHSARENKDVRIP
jgi:hypothetical protein